MGKIKGWKLVADYKTRKTYQSQYRSIYMNELINGGVKVRIGEWKQVSIRNIPVKGLKENKLQGFEKDFNNWKEANTFVVDFMRGNPNG